MVDYIGTLFAITYFIFLIFFLICWAVRKLSVPVLSTDYGDIQTTFYHDFSSIKSFKCIAQGYKVYSDTEMLNYLEDMNNKAALSGKCILRKLDRRGGWRLHETTRPGAYASVREAIAAYMDAEEAKNKA